jgi:serine/threonine-protein kinase
MVAVYLLRHDTNGQQQVALKVMLPEVAADEHAIRRCLREVNNMQSLEHRHLVRVHSHGSWHGIFFFVMDYCDGGDVKRLMRERGGTLPLEEAVGIVCQVLDALEYAHTANIRVELPDGTVESSRGLVHRDVSPHNILLAGSQAKLTDFGLAKAFEMAGLSGLTRTGISAGKPYFMPRQQVVNFRHAGPEVDVWAAAACLYNMLTGRYPRDFPRHMDLWQAVLETEPVPILKRDPSIPEKLAEVIDLALTDQHEIHFKTSAQLRSALEGVL